MTVDRLSGIFVTLRIFSALALASFSLFLAICSPSHVWPSGRFSFGGHPSGYADIAIAPFLLIYLPTSDLAVIICAAIVYVLPILANTLHGLIGVDRGHLDLFHHQASDYKILWAGRRPLCRPS